MKDKKVYVIADIGQNHNGDFKKALLLIDSAIEAGCDAVKFTLRDLEYEMTTEQGEQFYIDKNAYGETYKEHRKALEFTHKQIYILINYAKLFDLDFIVTISSGSLLKNKFIQEKILPRIDYIKVSSRDINNVFLMNELKHVTVPIIMSVGLSYTIRNDSLSFFDEDFKHLNLADCVMACDSIYPASLQHVQEKLSLYEDYMGLNYSNVTYGYSDNCQGYSSCIYAVNKFLKTSSTVFIKKHITLNKESRGKYHKLSLEPSELKEMVSSARDLERIYNSESLIKGTLDKHIKDINQNRYKMMRSICYAKDLNKGDVLKPDNLCLLSPGTGLTSPFIKNITGRILSRDVKSKSIVKLDDLH